MEFEFTIGGYPGPFIHLEFINDQLKCNYILPDTVSKCHWIDLKDNDKWDKAISYLGTRKWKQEYINYDSVDGTNWEISFESGIVNFNSQGSNMYPSGFYKFLKLINEVTKEVDLTIY